MEAFDAAVRELMLNQCVRASTFHRRLREVARDISKELPPVRVLYAGPYYCEYKSNCSSDTLYGYSRAFESFLEARQNIPESLATRCAMQCVSQSDWLERVRDVEWIAPFGQHVMEQWPFIGKLVKAYMGNNLGHSMERLLKIVSNERFLLDIPKTLQKIAIERRKRDVCWLDLIEDNIYEVDAPSLKDTRIKECDVWRKWDSRKAKFLDSQKDYSMYLSSALDEMSTQLCALQSELSLALPKERDALLMDVSEDQCEKMLRSIGTKFAGEKVDPGIRYRDNIDFPNGVCTKEVTFIEAINHYGEQHHLVWHYQCYFHPIAMRFLLLNPEYTEQLALQGNNVDCTQELGLCAASREHCKLHIAEVPWAAEWEVDRDIEDEGYEVDAGVEKIYLV